MTETMTAAQSVAIFNDLIARQAARVRGYGESIATIAADLDPASIEQLETLQMMKDGLGRELGRLNDLMRDAAARRAEAAREAAAAKAPLDLQRAALDLASKLHAVRGERHDGILLWNRALRASLKKAIDGLVSKDLRQMREAVQITRGCLYATSMDHQPLREQANALAERLG
jgi:hypothetical protein